MTATETTDAAGFARAVYSSRLDRFQWQLFLPGGRCVLVSADLSRRAVIPSTFVGEDEAHEVPVATVPAGVLAAARAGLAEADGADVHALLARHRQIAQVWGVADVVTVRPDLTDDQAWEVLRLVDRIRDTYAWITWETLATAAGSLFGPAPDGR